MSWRAAVFDPSDKGSSVSGLGDGIQSQPCNCLVPFHHESPVEEGRPTMDKLRGISYFCRAVELKSFAAAARSLESDPSRVSKVIAALESDLGLRLFNRSTRHLSLSQEGTAYYERCRQLLLDLEEAESTARDGVARPTGALRVGFHPAFRHLIFREIGTFLDANSSLRIETTIANSPAVLLGEGLDLVVRIGRLEDSSLVARLLGWARFVVCASPGYLQRFG